ncbi:MAG: hypothetical protein COA96_04525 [SAR86 cluster bacterium]|uniref:FHA domain-containing protein n=1 Tax=SAR86 cluster bacterium TaxID=2030880 RepID=A0A2A5B5T7_9GAMM|nr:MAG: hypothetical protein COA96_04525 [SAR86 cluster bacterium]
MPIYRGPDGKIIEERTKRIQDNKVTNLSQSSAAKSNTVDSSEDLTQKVNHLSAHAENTNNGHAKPNTDEDKTKLYFADNVVGKEASAEKATTQKDSDPVVGWLAIISGPGKGNVLKFGYGSNPIGRGGGARVSLDFGDEQISRGEHAIITYDPRGRKFYIQHGSGNNLTYLQDEPVLVPTMLKERAQITIGQTKLMFVSLCGDSFDWQDLKDGTSNEQT